MNYATDSGAAARALTPMLNFTSSIYAPLPYTVPSAISNAHNRPRFGFTNDFAAIIDGDSDETSDYVRGILIGSIIVLCVALLWFIVILGLKCAGQKRVGFFAGHLARPAGADEAQERRLARTTRGVRTAFVLSAIAVIIACVVFYARGAGSFRASFDEVRRGIDLVQNAAGKAADLAENVMDAERNVDSTVRAEGELCGLGEDLSADIRTGVITLQNTVGELAVKVDSTLDGFGEDLRSLVAITEELESQLDAADILFGVLIAISVIIIALVVAMLVGVIFAWRGVTNCLTKLLQYAIIWPLFVLFLLLSWIFATLFLTASLAGSDFCYAPDQYVESLMDQRSSGFTGILFGFVLFYISGCSIPPPGADDILEMATLANQVLLQAHDLVEQLAELPTATIASICSLTPDEVATLEQVLDFSHDAAHVLNRAVVGLRSVLACETFHPIYTTFVHRAFCMEGVGGLTAIFSSTLVISVFSMCMIMFRAALYPIRELGANKEATDIAKGKGEAAPDANAEVDEAVAVKNNEESQGEGNAKVEEAVVY